MDLPSWTQDYNPVGSAFLSTLLAAAPIIVLLGLLGLRGWPAPRAAGAGLITALLVAILAGGMPVDAAFASAGFGAMFGFFPIGWIVFNAVFLYALTVKTGEFEKVKASVASLSPDQRVQAMLIAFCFGAFIEGAAGFGTPVAISSALMIGAGFPPLQAAGLALIANTAPVAFGALGTPITTLHNVTGLDEMKISAMAGRQLPFFSLIIPAWMVVTMAGWRGLRGVWPAVLVCGGSFAVIQFLTANYLGPTLVDVFGGLGSLILLTLFLKVWQPAEPWSYSADADESPATTGIDSNAAHGEAEMMVLDGPEAGEHRTNYSRREIISAWVPWIILSLCVFTWGIPQVRTFLDGGLSGTKLPVRTAQVDQAPLAWWERPNFLADWSVVSWEIPRLHGRIYRDVKTVGGEHEPEPAVFRFNWLSTTGTGIFVAAVLSAIWMWMTPFALVRTFWQTLYRMRWPLFTIAVMLAIAYVTRFSGTDVTLGLAFTYTGPLYPYFAAMLGWLGVALTGSDTSCNALFGSLQRFTAEHLGLNPILIATANSTGGVMGKMIDAQSIVVSAAATNQMGGEGRILRFVFWHSVTLASLMGLLTLLQAYVFPGIVPN